MANPFRGLSRNVLIFGFVSLLTDASTEMILPILPLFLVSIGAEKAAIGLIEGVAESTSSLLKVFSGWYSDKLERRKGLVASGYGLSTVTKVFFALVRTWPQALAVRFVERVGKGIRTSPRDAIIADSTDPRLMGKAFGFHRAMDTSGAILGSLLAFLLVASFTYREIFLISVIPGAIAVVLILLIREGKRAVPKARSLSLSLANLSREFRLFLAIATIFAVANFSYAFLILRAQDLGVAARETTLYYLLFNVVYAALAMPFGWLSDKMPKRHVIAAGYGVYGLLALGFAMATAPHHALVLFLGYGLFMALIEGTQRAYIPRLVPEEARGTAYGVFHTAIGLAALPASLIAGMLWQTFGAKAPFLFASVLAILAAFLMEGLLDRKA